MYQTTYHRPTSLSEAKAQFSAAGEPKFLAGGQTLLPTMKMRLAAPSDLIDLGKLPELKGIAVTGSSVTIGGGVTHHDVANSADVRRAIPVLAELAGSIGDPAVRHRGTIGGSLANNDPAADYPAAVMALNATIVTDRREIAADDYFQGIFSTALEDDEIITKVVFPVPRAAGYEKFRNPASRYAMAAVFVARLVDGSVRVAVTGAGNNGVFRARNMEQALATSFSPTSVAGLAPDPSTMLSDLHGSAEYRAHLVSVMAKRAVADASG